VEHGQRKMGKPARESTRRLQACHQCSEKRPFLQAEVCQLHLWQMGNIATSSERSVVRQIPGRLRSTAPRQRTFNNLRLTTLSSVRKQWRPLIFDPLEAESRFQAARRADSKSRTAQRTETARWPFSSEKTYEHMLAPIRLSGLVGFLGGLATFLVGARSVLHLPMRTLCMSWSADSTPRRTITPQPSLNFYGRRGGAEGSTNAFRQSGVRTPHCRSALIRAASHCEDMLCHQVGAYELQVSISPLA
jgi:hypothetical protein